ncbi:protein translocase subunit SecD [Polymorphobacter multimanifer]|uniref:protein translocase subunit SecD n=1 Tax=Polymorphobacter multimanifer TaxID=1070431 RepID=UPI0016632FBB|nr:protein translocase subunit SecD [Polymorphobacter multimanifer]GGI73387.1 protein translocase subunit SecD [Polymorphobacter multimanifer]
MLDFPKWKIWTIAATLLAGLIFAMPNFVPASAWPEPLPQGQLNLGLDLRGGSHLMLEATADDVLKARLEALEETVRTELRIAEGGAIAFTDLSQGRDRVSLTVTNAADLDRALSVLRRVSTPVGGITGTRETEVSNNGPRITLQATQAGVALAVDSAMAQAVEVIRRRIDELGTREPNISRQGTNRIVVQVPGLQDPDAPKSLIGKTAKLELKLVDVDADPALVAEGRAPPGSQILPSIEGGTVVVKRRAIITGDQLIDSQVSTNENGQPAVSFRFDSTGGRRFAQATQATVGRPIAIILDNTVISAPSINEPILGGSGVISGSYTVATANELAILLRSGKLPVELKVVEERTVGPDLGADSIRAGAIASVLATIFVAVFMIITYGRFGVYSVVALIANGVLVMAIMSGLGATLTLPGIAGFVLTVGAAVDANVLINERIREELRRGRAVVGAVETGYREASRTIFDANVTNVIAAAIMFAFGSGPVKGFAVVLTIGIITSVFTAVTITRLMVACWLRSRPKSLVL